MFQTILFAPLIGALVVGLFGLLLVGVPVAFALGGMGLVLLYLGGFSPLMAPQGILSTLGGFILLAVPLFLLMGNVLLKGGVGRDLFVFFDQRADGRGETRGDPACGEKCDRFWHG